MSKQVTGWVGWIWFGAIVMIIVGAFNLIDGLVALFKHTVYVTTSGQLIVFNYTTWGWIFLILGIVQILVGLSLMANAGLGSRIVAIILVTLSMIAQISFITANPFWSILVIGLCVLVLWALCVHGDEAATLAESKTGL